LNNLKEFTKSRNKIESKLNHLLEHVKNINVNDNEITEKQKALLLKQTIDILSNPERTEAVKALEELQEEYGKLEQNDIMNYHKTYKLANELENVPYDKYEPLIQKAINIINNILEKTQENIFPNEPNNNDDDKNNNDENDSEKPGKGTGGKDSIAKLKETLGEIGEIEEEILKILLKTEFKKINNSNSSKLIEKIEGEYKKVREIADPSEILYANPEDIGSPELLLKIAEETLEVNVNAIKEIESKTMIILLDISGSMTNGIKIKIVNAIISYLISKVEQKEINLMILPYAGIIFDEFIIEAFYKDLKDKDYKKIIKKVLQLEYDHGDTYIHNTIKEIQKEYSETGKIRNKILPDSNIELLVITDGQDKTEPIDPMFKTHTCTIGQENEGIKKYSEVSKGISMHLPDRNVVGMSIGKQIKIVNNMNN
jgi:hypothetical protein